MSLQFLDHLRHAPVLVWHAGPDGAWDWVNDAWLAFTGRSHAEALGWGWLDDLHADDADACRSALAAACAGRHPLEIEHRLRHREGGYRWLLCRGAPDADGAGYTGYGLDISALKTAQAAFEEQQHRLHQAQAIARLGNFTFDLQRDSWDGSPILAEIFGIDDDYPRTLAGWLGLVVPAEQEAMGRYLEEVVARRDNFQREFWILRPRDGEVRCLKGEGVIDYTRRGRPLTMVGTLRDITEEVSLRDRLAVDATVFDHSQQAILITDPQRRIVRINAAFRRILGYTQEDVRGQNPRVLNSGIQDPAFYQAMWHSLDYTGKWRNEIWNRRKDGTLCPGILDINAVRDGEGRVMHYVGVFTEITELKNTQRHLERLANFDPLTGLPNRVLLMDRLEQAVAAARRHPRPVAVCFLDLDGFKPINDQYGHACGDALLAEVAGRLLAAVRGGDTVARIGGDEFVLLLTEMEEDGDLTPALERVLAGVAKPYALPEGEFAVTASLGATLFPEDPADAAELLRHADEAMYRAKRAGRNCYRLYASGEA